MCFGGGKSTQTVVQQSQIPQWVTDKAQANVGTAESLASRPFPTYAEPRVADFSSDETLAMDLVRGSTGAWAPATDAAMGVGHNLATQRWPNVDLKGYMSPYMDEVVNASLDRLTRYGDQARKAIGSRAHHAGAFGDARHGVAEGELDRNILDTAGQMIAQGKQGAWTDALRAFQADNATNLSGANFMASLAQAAQKMGLTDIGALLQTGGLERGMDQANLDLAYKDFLNEFYYPVEGLNLRMSALSGSPYERTQTSTTTGPGANTFAQTAGGLGALAGGAASLYRAFG